jgi:hypothetical protein
MRSLFCEEPFPNGFVHRHLGPLARLDRRRKIDVNTWFLGMRRGSLIPVSGTRHMIVLLLGSRKGYSRQEIQYLYWGQEWQVLHVVGALFIMWHFRQTDMAVMLVASCITWNWGTSP